MLLGGGGCGLDKFRAEGWKAKSYRGLRLRRRKAEASIGIGL